MSRFSREELEQYVLLQDEQFFSLLEGIQKELNDIQGEMVDQKASCDIMAEKYRTVKRENRDLKKKLKHILKIIVENKNSSRLDVIIEEEEPL